MPTDSPAKGPTPPEPQLLDPAHLSQSRRQLLLALGEQEYRLWINNPITRAYHQYLADQIAYLREGVADLVELGALGPDHQKPTQNANVLGGRLNQLRDLLDLKLETIQAFYSEDSDDRQDQ